jgi:hypothetical protein
MDAQLQNTINQFKKTKLNNVTKTTQQPKKQSYHTFQEKSSGEQRDTKLVEKALIKWTGFYYNQCTAVKEQKMGIDYYVTLDGKKQLTVDVKIQYEEYNHPTEMLLELDNTYTNGVRYKLGWAMDENLVSDYIVDFLKPQELIREKIGGFSILTQKARTGVVFIYDSKLIHKWVKENINNFPTGCYIPVPALNKNMYTTNVIVPRKYLEHALVFNCKVNTLGEVEEI